MSNVVCILLCGIAVIMSSTYLLKKGMLNERVGKICDSKYSITKSAMGADKGEPIGVPAICR